jgi:hypothetical protein
MSVSATLANVVGTVIVTGTVGALLTYFWHVRQKRREVTLAITSEFYKLYGEIIAVWKLWNYWYEKNNAKRDQSEVQDEKWELLQRATAASGGAEAILVRLAAERHLSPQDIAVLGSFRQASKTVRKAIEDNHPVPWYSDKAYGYLALKYLSVRVASIVARREPLKLPSAESAAAALRAITANFWESGEAGNWRSFESSERWSDTEWLTKKLEDLNASVARRVDSRMDA